MAVNRYSTNDLLRLLLLSASLGRNSGTLAHEAHDAANPVSLPFLFPLLKPFIHG